MKDFFWPEFWKLFYSFTYLFKFFEWIFLFNKKLKKDEFTNKFINNFEIIDN